MRERLIEIIGLRPDRGQSGVSDDQIISAVSDLLHVRVAFDEARKSEKAISDLVAQSCGALSRESAKEILKTRAAALGGAAKK